MGAKGLHPSCESQLLISKSILFDCSGGSLPNSPNAYKGVAGSTLCSQMDGEKLAEADSSRDWGGRLQTFTQLSPWERGLSSGPGTPEWSFPQRNRELLFGEGVPMGWDSAYSSGAFVMGQHPVLLRACCWQGSCLPAVWAGAQYRCGQFQASTSS